jgi:hypothetical protein
MDPAHFSRNLEVAGDLLTGGGSGPHPRSRGLPDQAISVHKEEQVKDGGR